MKLVYNHLKEPIVHYFKKDLFKEGIKSVNILNQKMKALEIEDKIDVRSNNQLYESQIFTYKPSLIQQKINNDLNHDHYFKLNNSTQFGIKKVGLTNLIYRQFSTKVQKMDNVAPQIRCGGDFEKLVTQSTVFTDKSLFIKEILGDPSEVILITMPRRWGKSVNMDMLKRFLEIKVDESGNSLKNEDRVKELNYKLFAGGEINVVKDFKTEQKKLEPLKLIHQFPDALSFQGKCPVIFIDFQDCKGGNYKEVESKVKTQLNKCFKQHEYLQNSSKLSEEQNNIIKQYVGEQSSESLKLNQIQDGLRFLSEMLYKHFGVKPYVLIDEYDAAANKAYLEFSDEDAKRVSELFRGIFESALKGNKHLEKGVMTGVQYIVKSGMLSGLNNLSKYNVTNTKYSKYYGINQAEMDELLKHFNISTEKALKIKDWYNGYKSNIGTSEEPMFIDKYNIWSVVNYLNKQYAGFESYWENNSLGSVIDKKILKNPIIKNIVEDLINNNHLVLTKLTSDFSIDDFKTLRSILDKHDQINIKQDGIDLLFSYLFITGYLTNTSTTNEYSLPNKEVKIEFEKKLKDYYDQIFNISSTKFNELTTTLTKVFSEDNTGRVVHILKTEFGPQLTNLISTLKLYDDGNKEIEIKGAFKNEDLMHSLLNNIAIQVVNAKFASERYTTKPDGSKGRADIVLEKNGKGVVIEMKYNAKDVKDALEQAKEYSKLIKDAHTKIFIGCNITDQQKVFLSGYIVDSNATIHFDYPLTL